MSARSKAAARVLALRDPRPKPVARKPVPKNYGAQGEYKAPGESAYERRRRQRREVQDAA